MNQILNTTLKRKIFFTKNIFLKIQLTFSIFVTIIVIIVFIFYYISAKQKEKLSLAIVDNYNIYRLYSNNIHYTTSIETTNNSIFGIIEIPKIDIYYPIFSNLDEKLLQISPCKFYGNSLTECDNICIAGHNYNNSMFFSNLSKMDYNDKIYLYDNSGKKYVYSVTDIYEVKSNDLSPVLNYDNRYNNLTLITCNNLNLNRLVVKSKQESS